MNMEKVKKQSAKEQVLSTLRTAVFKGDLKQGEEITQNEMADKLGVSRMPVREAFQILHHEGIIRIQDNRRVVVVGLTRDDAADHYDIRAHLEALAAKKACDASTYFDRLNEIHATMESSPKEDFVALNEMFHQVIWEAAGSARLYSMLTNLWNGLQPQFPEFVQFQNSKSLLEHEKIVQAITNQDKEAAFERLRDHILRTKQDFLDTINLS